MSSAFITAVKPDFDSGLADPGSGGSNVLSNVPNCPIGAVLLAGAFFANTTGAQATITVKDANGVAIVPAMSIPANTPIPLPPFNLMPVVGPLQWSCSLAIGVNGKIWGYTG